MDQLQQAELDDARRGTLYFLGKLEVVKKPSFDCGLISNFVSGTSIISDLQSASTSILNKHDLGRKFMNGLGAIMEPIQKLIQSFFDALSEKLLALYGEASGVLEWVAEFGTWAVSTFAGSLSDLIPGWGYVQAAADIYEAVKTSVVSAIKWLGQVYSGWGIELLEGGPSIMAKSIAQHNAAGLAGGLKDLTIESVKVGLQASGDAAAGVGAIVGAVTGILQRIANLIGYCAQRYLLNKVITQAGHQWKNTGIYQSNHDQFTEWFRRSCALTPIVAALTLQSGFAAHPYRFMRLISNEDELIDQQKFNDGVKHIEKLKDLSKDYLKEYQDSYKIVFQSADPVVSGMLDNAKK